MSILGQDGVNTYASNEEELEVLTMGFSQIVRSERDSLLTECDWVVTKAQESGGAVSAEWTTYRTALRDITASDGFPLNITWPEKP